MSKHDTLWTAKYIFAFTFGYLYFVLIMHKILLLFIVLCLFGKHDCSFLSRLKNRYEYVPQENNIQLFTEDMYDFEFTNIETTTKLNSWNIFNRIDTTEEDIIYAISSSISSSTNEANQKRLDAFRTYERNTVPDTSGPIFLFRPTLHSSVMTSSKPRHSWPTYFSQKTLPPLSGNLEPDDWPLFSRTCS